jgi:hypothetical protein
VDPGEDVGDGEYRGDAVVAEDCEFLGRENQQRDDVAEEKNYEKRGENTLCAFAIEVGDAETPMADVGVDVGSDEKSGDDEEDVDADEPSFQEGTPA